MSKTPGAVRPVPRAQANRDGLSEPELRGLAAAAVGRHSVRKIGWKARRDVEAIELAHRSLAHFETRFVPRGSGAKFAILPELSLVFASRCFRAVLSVRMVELEL